MKPFSIDCPPTSRDDAADAAPRLSTLIGAILWLSGEYSRGACPHKAAAMADHLGMLARHGGADPSLRALASSLHDHWRRLAGAPVRSARPVPLH